MEKIVIIHENDRISKQKVRYYLRGIKMGTRHLIAVYIDGSYKVAQYGKWDVYPDGQGLDVLHFLREKMDDSKFKSALRNTTYIGETELTAIWKRYGMDDDGSILLKDMDRMKKDYPELNRDTGAEILEMLQGNPDGMRLQDNIRFAADSLLCEWAWVINFDDGTFEAYEGFNKQDLTPEDRFYFLREYEEDGYHGVKLVAKWGLNDLPTDEDFLSAFPSDEEV